MSYSPLFHVASLDYIFLVYHAPVILNLRLQGWDEAPLVKQRILTWSNKQNVNKFLERVQQKICKSQLVPRLESLLTKQVLDEDEAKSFVLWTTNSRYYQALQRSQYSTDGYTPNLKSLQKVKRYWRNILRNKRKQLSITYISSLWEVFDPHHLLFSSKDLCDKLQTVQQEIK